MRLKNALAFLCLAFFFCLCLALSLAFCCSQGGGWFTRHLDRKTGALLVGKCCFRYRWEDITQCRKASLRNRVECSKVFCQWSALHVFHRWSPQRCSRSQTCFYTQLRQSGDLTKGVNNSFHVMIHHLMLERIRAIKVDDIHEVMFNTSSPFTVLLI